MTPIVNGLEGEFGNQITVIRLDAAVPANDRLQQQYGLRGHPAFAVLDENQQVVQVFFGPQSEETLREAMTMVTIRE